MTDQAPITNVYLTVDTELSAMHFRRHGKAGLDDNFARAVMGRTGTGRTGMGRTGMGATGAGDQS